MNVSLHVEENEASSIEFEDERYADLREPLYITAGSSNDRSGRTGSSRSDKNQKQPPEKGREPDRRHDLKDKKRRKGKTLRFGKDGKGRVLCKYYPSTQALTEEEIASYWYREELDLIQSKARREAQKSEGTEYQEHFLGLFEGCQEADFKNTFHESNLVEKARLVCLSRFRGLEIATYGPSMLRENDDVVWSVLEQQDENESRKVPARMRTKKLAVVSKGRSKRAKRLAYAIAHGDALVAHSLYVDDNK